MAALKRNALLKELSRKLEDQVIHQSGGTSHTIPETSGAGRSEARRKKSYSLRKGR
ncbi:hypothetical protein H8D57_02275 [bacterium]|nr:hypothetical protein [bacterium]